MCLNAEVPKVPIDLTKAVGLISRPPLSIRKHSRVHEHLGQAIERQDFFLPRRALPPEVDMSPHAIAREECTSPPLETRSHPVGTIHPPQVRKNARDMLNNRY